MGFIEAKPSKVKVMNRKVDILLGKETHWRAEFEALRAMALESGMTEELKWGQPCYTIEESNVLLIHGFKNYCAILFMKGALLKDSKRILIQQTPNVQAGRQIRFTSLDEIVKMLKDYPKMVVQLEGHTDVKGDPKLNMKLSQDRVDAVKLYLVSKGSNKVKIKTKAYGGTSPLSRENTEIAHKMNRRVELRILEN